MSGCINDAPETVGGTGSENEKRIRNQKDVYIRETFRVHHDVNWYPQQPKSLAFFRRYYRLSVVEALRRGMDIPDELPPSYRPKEIDLGS